MIEREGALVEVEVGAAGPVPLGAVHLRSVVANLLGNSLRYRDPARRPVVRVEASTDVDTTVLTVADNGLGLDVERVGDRLFGLFNRFHTHVEGSGMGLHLTRSIVRAAGGDVTVESTPGAGATFRLELPHG